MAALRSLVVAIVVFVLVCCTVPLQAVGSDGNLDTESCGSYLGIQQDYRVPSTIAL